MTLMRPVPDASTRRGATYSTLLPRLALRRHLYLTLSRSEPGRMRRGRRQAVAPHFTFLEGAILSQLGGELPTECASCAMNL